MLCGCRKKRKAEAGALAVASKKSKQETEDEKGLRVCYAHECLLIGLKMTARALLGHYSSSPIITTERVSAQCFALHMPKQVVMF